MQPGLGMQELADSQINSLADFAGNFPSPGDADLLTIGLEDWHAATRADPELADFADRLRASDAGARLLGGVFGNSPFLSACLNAEPQLLWHLLEDDRPEEGAEATLRWIYESLAAAAPLDADKETVMAALRIAKRRIALLIALCDMGKLWPLMRLTGVLSDFAGAAVEICCRHLLLAGAAKGDITLPHPDDPTRDSGLIV